MRPERGFTLLETLLALAIGGLVLGAAYTAVVRAAAARDQAVARGREVNAGRQALLEVSGLRTAFPTRTGIAYAVAGVSFDLAPRECVGIVGESGSGKSMTCRSILGLVPRPGAIVDGSIRWRGQELVGAGERRLRRIRGGEID